MKIYLVLRSEDDLRNVNILKGDISRNLSKYYGRFADDCCEAFVGNNGLFEVYVMDNPRFPNKEPEIAELLRRLVSNLYPNAQPRINLDYAALNPSFDPKAITRNTSASANEPESNIGSENISNQRKKPSDEFDYEKLSENYEAEEPKYSFDQIILSDTIREQIMEAVGTIQVEHKVFDEWGLRSIIPNASSAMSFYGPPGTGKSMAAEAIANKLGKKILRATYADIESKFHGEGPKMVKAIFRAAERDDAILFLDESDSLLSKRLTNVSDGSAQAINSMRSQLLICLEQFRGIVIFATNLVVNYDKAFLSRLINIEFTVPDKEARKAIWYQHLWGKGLHIPLADDVDTDELSEKFVFCGREIKNSVKDACVTVAIAGRDMVTQADLIKSAEKTKVESEKVLKADDHTKSIKLNDEQADAVKKAINDKLDNTKSISVDELNSEEAAEESDSSHVNSNSNGHTNKPHNKSNKKRRQRR